jgi:hypothetical protein
MKKIKFLILNSIAAVLFSCTSMDVPPINIVSEADVFSSVEGLDAYMARMYADLPWTLLRFHESPSNFYTGEVINNENNPSNVGSGTSGWWGYTAIRNQCVFLEQLPAYSSKFTETQVKAWTGEVLFLRAFTYFEMVKRYGGIPIVDRVLNYPDESIEQLQLPRNKEAECYDFILADLDKAIASLPETSQAIGRANKYIAYGLKARVALQAASIAKFGTVQLDGVVGVDPARANEYYQKAWEAAEAVISSGKFALYRNANADKVTNFREAFLGDKSGKTPATNKELMFAQYFVPITFTPNGYEFNHIPAQIGFGYTKTVPTLDLVESFEDVYGNPLRLNTGTDNAPVWYNNRVDLFANAEPRLRASVIFPGDVFKGEVIDIRYAILKEGANTSAINSADLAIAANTSAYNGEKILGASGMQLNDASFTVSGFHLAKWMDYNLTLNEYAWDHGTTTPWQDMRYAEILLTAAEAAVEWGQHKDLAAQYINDIRDRAGAFNKNFTANSITRNDIRNEWGKEMFFENKTYWNYMRWRVFEEKVHDKHWGLLRPIMSWDTKKWYMQRSETGGNFASFNARFYYLAIPGDAMTKNSKLVNNPGY